MTTDLTQRVTWYHRLRRRDAKGFARPLWLDFQGRTQGNPQVAVTFPDRGIDIPSQYPHYSRCRQSSPDRS